MAAPKARKKAPPSAPRGREKSRTTAAGASVDPCSACGAAANRAHVSGCPNGACGECGMLGGNHDFDCALHPNAVRAGAEHVVDGMTGEVRTDTVDGKDAKIDARPTDPQLGVKADVDTLLMELAAKEQVVRMRRSERGRASNALKLALEQRDNVIALLAQRGLDLREPQLPGMDGAGDGADLEDENDDEVTD